MKISKTEFDDLFILEPMVHGDLRGYFMESYNQKKLAELGIHHQFVQDNQSRSRKGVLRGLHYQDKPYAQTKLIRVLAGSIIDIVLDLRRDKSTFRKSMSVELSSENNKQLLVPKGFAHGFFVLSEFADVLYKTDEYYQPNFEAGINLSDSTLGLSHLLKGNQIIMSERDKGLPYFDKAVFNF